MTQILNKNGIIEDNQEEVKRDDKQEKILKTVLNLESSLKKINIKTEF